MNQNIKPMPLWLSLVFFGAPGLMIYWGMYYGVPLLLDLGFPLVYVFPAFMSIPGILLLVGALLAYKLEGHPWQWSDFQARFRLHAIKGKAWLWAIGIWLICIVSDAGLEGIGKWLSALPLTRACR